MLDLLGPTYHLFSFTYLLGYVLLLVYTLIMLSTLHSIWHRGILPYWASQGSLFWCLKLSTTGCCHSIGDLFSLFDEWSFLSNQLLLIDASMYLYLQLCILNIYAWKLLVCDICVCLYMYIYTCLCTGVLLLLRLRL